MKKYGSTNSDGLCTVKNPYKSPKGFTSGTPITQWHEFANRHPPLALYTPSGHLVKDAENVEVEGPVWFSRLRGAELWRPVLPEAYVRSNYSFEHYQAYCDTMGAFAKQGYLLTVPPTEREDKEVKTHE